MSKEEILGSFYDSVTFTAAGSAWKTSFDPERMKGIKLAFDLVDAKTGDVVAEVGQKMTPRLGRKLTDAGMAERLVSDEELTGQYLAADVINEETGEVLYEAGDKVDGAMLEALRERAQIPRIELLASTGRPNTGLPLHTLLAIDRNATAARTR